MVRDELHSELDPEKRATGLGSIRRSVATFELPRRGFQPPLNAPSLSRAMLVIALKRNAARFSTVD
jgi:hypothetical protein